MEGEKTTVLVGSTFSLTAMGFITWLIFLILKLTNTWNISWFWVWFPLWIPWAVELSLLLIAIIIAVIVFLINIRLDE